MPIDERIQELLANASPEDLQRIIEESRDSLKKITKKEGQEQSEEIRKQLQPLEEKSAKAEEGYTKVKAAYDQQIKKLKIERKKAVEEADERRKAARAELNAKRAELGLKSTRKPSLGTLVSWYVKPNIVEGQKDTVIIGVQDQPETNVELEISDEGKVDAKELRTKLFEEKNIDDPGGGKQRGLVTRIKLAYIHELTILEEKENK